MKLMMIEKSKLSQLLEKDVDEEEIDLTLSYSKYSDFDRNGAISLIRRREVTGAGLKHGSLVDDLLVDNLTGSEICKDTYYRFDGEKPSATLGVLCDIIIKNFTDIPTKLQVAELVVINKFWSNIKDPITLESKYNIPEFWNYLKCMYEAIDKVVITTQEYNDAIEIVSILKNHKYSKYILINSYEKIFQMKFNMDYKGFKLRGILDLITIDHKNKRVWFTDLKTGKGPALEFEDSFVKWRYYFQGALYTLAFDTICKELNLVGYKLQPFQFLYISKSDKLPLLYIMSDKWLNASFKGFKIGKYIYRGIDELTDEIYWCWKNKQYVITKYISDNNGIVGLRDNFIEVNE